ncbi:hypothetical protein ml_510 [Mollivirus sibericum]|uniref:hypothetical protein n=1 Tax=Mollivirus sibericum TaxID=1678078 RepID=UPI0006B2D9A4|nr:hypothetical protein ml_510 [Mollivirus sibericum]ALD62312.1 hypothetical protein ml_510 [Mollivirus sibericum]
MAQETSPRVTVGYENMLAVFERDGEVVSDSPKNRLRLYRHLGLVGIDFTKELVGYTAGERSLCRRSGSRPIRWNTKLLVKWINQGRILAEDLRECCQGDYYDERFPFEQVEPLFAPSHTMTREEQSLLLERIWDGRMLEDHLTPFDRCVLRKSVIRITKKG